MRLNEWIPKRRDFAQIRPSPSKVRAGAVRFVVVLVLLVAITALVLASLWLLGITLTIPEQIGLTDLLSTFGPLVLSGALVYLYYQQKELLAEETRSQVSVNQFIGANGDEVNIQVSNSGSGSVRAIFLKVDVEFEGDLTGGENYHDLHTTDQDGNRRSFLKPYEGHSPFSSILLLPVSVPGEDIDGYTRFSQAMGLAESYGASSGHLTLTLVYEDAVQTGRITIFDEDFDVNSQTSFEEFIERFPAHSGSI